MKGGSEYLFSETYLFWHQWRHRIGKVLTYFEQVGICGGDDGKLCEGGKEQEVLTDRNGIDQQMRLTKLDNLDNDHFWTFETWANNANHQDKNLSVSLGEGSPLLWELSSQSKTIQVLTCSARLAIFGSRVNVETTPSLFAPPPSSLRFQSSS